MRYVNSMITFLVVAIALSFLTPALAYYNQTDSDTIIFYPESMTYVDRMYPLNDFGSQSELKVRDWMGNAFEEDGETFYDGLHAARTYLKFSNADFQTALADYSVTEAALNIYLTDVVDGASPNGTERINVRLVSSASAFDYIQGLTWDAQISRTVTFGQVYATRSFDPVNEADGVKQWISAGGHNLAELVDLWTANPGSNYGFFLENEFDGGWHELEDAVKYSVDNPNEMNELEAVFAKGSNYPCLRVTVAPKVIPEPLSCALMLLGSGVLGLAAKRKKRT